jgi:hypothetical protein
MLGRFRRVDRLSMKHFRTAISAAKASIRNVRHRGGQLPNRIGISLPQPRELPNRIAHRVSPPRELAIDVALHFGLVFPETSCR